MVGTHCDSETGTVQIPPCKGGGVSEAPSLSRDLWTVDGHRESNVIFRGVVTD